MQRLTSAHPPVPACQNLNTLSAPASSHSQHLLGLRHRVLDPASPLVRRRVHHRRVPPALHVGAQARQRECSGCSTYEERHDGPPHETHAPRFRLTKRMPLGRTPAQLLYRAGGLVLLAGAVAWVGMQPVDELSAFALSQKGFLDDLYAGELYVADEVKGLPRRPLAASSLLLCAAVYLHIAASTRPPPSYLQGLCWRARRRTRPRAQGVAAVDTAAGLASSGSRSTARPHTEARRRPCLSSPSWRKS